VTQTEKLANVNPHNDAIFQTLRLLAMTDSDVWLLPGPFSLSPPSAFRHANCHSRLDAHTKVPACQDTRQRRVLNSLLRNKPRHYVSFLAFLLFLLTDADRESLVVKVVANPKHYKAAIFEHKATQGLSHPNILVPSHWLVWPEDTSLPLTSAALLARTGRLR
jgi:hypothetical protein